MSSLHVHQYEPAVASRSWSKPILVLVHGGALSHRMYKDVIPILTSEGYQIMAPDLPGHGLSVATGPFTFKKATELLSQEIVNTRRADDHNRKIVLVGISLGGQVVLDMLQHHPDVLDAAIVSGASIHGPDDRASWEMPHMPASDDWVQVMTEDVNMMGMENAAELQQESLSFRFQTPYSTPPVLVTIGENDVAMAKRDFEELSKLIVSGNERSRSMELKDAWHNHPIDIPERFAKLIHHWAQTATQDEREEVSTTKEPQSSQSVPQPTPLGRGGSQ